MVAHHLIYFCRDGEGRPPASSEQLLCPKCFMYVCLTESSQQPCEVGVLGTIL